MCVIDMSKVTLLMSRSSVNSNQNQRWRETEDTGKKRKAVQVRASNSIKWSTPEYGMTWREKYNCCVFISGPG